jgi:hypothetical protein
MGPPSSSAQLYITVIRSFRELLSVRLRHTPTYPQAQQHQPASVGFIWKGLRLSQPRSPLGSRSPRPKLRLGKQLRHLCADPDSHPQGEPLINEISSLQESAGEIRSLNRNGYFERRPHQRKSAGPKPRPDPHDTLKDSHLVPAERLMAHANIRSRTLRPEAIG